MMMKFVINKITSLLNKKRSKTANISDINKVINTQFNRKIGIFDPEWYRGIYPDVVSEDQDVLRHYMDVGYREGRNPGPHFDTIFYLEMYPDVKKSKLNPLLHYVLYGRAEGRKCNDIDVYNSEIGIYRASMPLVSALVTTYNHEGFICEAIESLLNQTYSAVEIIVVDDGSEDRTFELACQYRDQGVRVLRGPQKGPSHAMNMAMAEASGDFFLLQSGDDMSLAERADVQVRALAKADLHAGLPILIDGEGQALADTDFPVFFRSNPKDMRSLFKTLYEDGNFLCASSVALRRTVWEKLDGFHPGFLQLQDYEYWMRALADGLVLDIDTDRLVYYRLHNSNLSSSRNDIRMHRELGAIFRVLGQSVSNDFIMAILSGQSFEGSPWQDIDREILLALFYLRHPIESVRQIGIEGLISLLGNVRLSAVLNEEFGLSSRAIFDLFLRK